MKKIITISIILGLTLAFQSWGGLLPCAVAEERSDSGAVDGTLQFGIRPKIEEADQTESGDRRQEAKLVDVKETKDEEDSSDLQEDYNAEYEEDEEYVEETPDPHEDFNRAMFEFNDFLYDKVMEPVATVYSEITDEDFRSMVLSFFSNIAMPVRLVSSIIQGNGEKAGRTLERFFINSTLGVGGLVDVAKSEFDIKKVEEDFDQALAHHGVGTGSYFVLPILGPTTTRGVFGRVVDSVLDPSWLITPGGVPSDLSMGAGKEINETSTKLDVKEDIDDMAIDPYLSVRDLYLQYRKGKEAE